MATNLPQYRTTETCYCNERLYYEGDTFYFTGKPAHYMEPINEAADAMVKKHPPVYVDPLDHLTVIAK